MAQQLFLIFMGALIVGLNGYSLSHAIEQKSHWRVGLAMFGLALGALLVMRSAS